MDLQGRPRSIAELEFVARMDPCETCGQRDSFEVVTGGVGTRWVVTATCSRCGQVRTLQLATEVDLFSIDQPPLELGPREPSEILDPFDLMREVDRLAPRITDAVEKLDGAAWISNVRLVERLRTALHELAKFIPVGHEVIPLERAHTAEGTADQMRRPERYTREWIDEETARWASIAEGIVEDAPRVFAADPSLSRATPPRGAINTDALADHGRWLERERRGPGRLDVVTWDGDELALGGTRMTACRLEGVRFRRASMRFARAEEAELVEVDLTGADLEGASVQGGRLRGCVLSGVHAVATLFDGARVAGCVFDRAQLEYSQWTDAEVVGCSFRGANLSRARLEGARFTQCDFREAVFEGCELTDAVLDGCLFAGASGMPSLIDRWRVVDADIGNAELLLDELQRGASRAEPT